MEATTTRWNVDPMHTQLQFKVKHLGIANVSGTFKTFEGTVQTTSGDFDQAQIELTIESGSVDTNNPTRDGHLKSDIFFNAEKYPQIVFKGLLHKQAADYVLAGNLTIGAITQDVSLHTELTGTGEGRNGDTRAGFEVSGKIKRADYGMNLDMLTGTGGLVVGEEIKLHFDVELIKAS